MITKYQKRISGPLLDRIDIHVEVLRVDYQKLSSDRLGESSETIRCRVEAACQRQRERFAKIKSTNLFANADMRVAEIRQFCKLDEAGESLRRAVDDDQVMREEIDSRSRSNSRIAKRLETARGWKDAPTLLVSIIAGPMLV